ncbi:unnamed protein product [Brugia pahangi]|uniref:S ribonuclease n=1 Tax=Brugia pahangi TaxID=6280 RepID=A0A0N4TX97_BRUPA|nr:unnamed protein product [Brugia pahangi]
MIINWLYENSGKRDIANIHPSNHTLVLNCCSKLPEGNDGGDDDDDDMKGKGCKSRSNGGQRCADNDDDGLCLGKKDELGKEEDRRGREGELWDRKKVVPGCYNRKYRLLFEDEKVRCE